MQRFTIWRGKRIVAYCTVFNFYTPLQECLKIAEEECAREGIKWTRIERWNPPNIFLTRIRELLRGKL